MEATNKKDRDEWEALYKEQFPDMKPEDVAEEVAMKALGRRLATPRFVERFANRSIIRRAIDFGKMLLDALRADNAGRLEIAETEKLIDMMNRALQGVSQKTNEATSIPIKQYNLYPYDMQKIIKDYLAATDQELLRQAILHKEKKQTKFIRSEIGNVTDKMADNIQALTGISVSGFTTNINSNAFNHIEKRHGENGVADQTMMHLEDVARLNYVLTNFDNISLISDNGKPVFSNEFRTADNKPAPMVMVTKKINGTYYCAVAVTDSKYNKIWVVTSFISTKEGLTQVLSDELSSLSMTSETDLASHPSNNSIPQNPEKSTLSEKKSYNLTPEAAEQAAREAAEVEQFRNEQDREAARVRQADFFCILRRSY